MLGTLPPGSGLGSLLGEGETSLPGADNQDLVREALAARGIRYRWGGISRRGFDCSGLTSYLFRRMRGVSLPHSASRQARFGKRVALQELREGDLVFFHTYRRGISHVGLYIGGKRFVHAPNRRRRVRVDELSGYYLKRFVTARRLNSTAPARPFGTSEPPSANEEMPPVEIPEQIPDLKPEMPSDTMLATNEMRVPPNEADEAPPASVETGSQ